MADSNDGCHMVCKLGAYILKMGDREIILSFSV